MGENLLDGNKGLNKAEALLVRYIPHRCPFLSDSDHLSQVIINSNECKYSSSPAPAGSFDGPYILIIVEEKK